MRLVIAGCIAVLLISCKKSENQKATVDFAFQTRSGQTDYLFSEYFTNGDGKKIRIEVLQFYISDIRFVTKKGKEMEAGDIALVKCDFGGKGTMAVKVPAGDYTAIRFGIGVPEAMNAEGPDAYTDADHPLSIMQNTYWGMNSMYRFVMVDGKYDLTGDGTDDGGFSYHTGFNDSYREVELVHDFSFDRKGTYAATIGIDLAKLFYVSGSMIDVASESNFHGDYTNIGLSLRVSDNFAAALSIQ
ncbi:MAG: hypothetical protein HYZ14_09685 [Bacteroidetes bacterium]|nr:hypothetical protein [Bacteroidota bacterium]